MGTQDKLNSFYSIDNHVRIEVIMDPEKWEQVILKAKPRHVGNPCSVSDGSEDKPNFDWTIATSVTISSTKIPQKTTFTNVAIRKKSTCGSLSYKKPSLRLNFSKYNPANKHAAKSLMGTHALTLNNSKQDPSYIRQPLGYELFRQAGIPNLRCNFATVTVNGQFWGGDPGEKEDTADPRCPPRDGVYINVETIAQETFVKHQFHNSEGNLYKVVDGDLVSERIKAGKVSFKGFSPYKDSKDILLAAQEIEEHGLAGAKRVVDWDQYICFLAMEMLTNNGDGYNAGLNNCFIYNDVKAVSDPKVSKDQINLKLIPMGIDNILPSWEEIGLDRLRSVLSKLTIADRNEKANLDDQILKLADSVFGVKNLTNFVYPFFDDGLDVLKSANANLTQADIDDVLGQLNRYRSRAYDLVGPTKAKGGLSCCTAM